VLNRGAYGLRGTDVELHLWDGGRNRNKRSVGGWSDRLRVAGLKTCGTGSDSALCSNNSPSTSAAAPTRAPIERKESYRWLENLKLSTVLLAEPERIVHIGDRESDIYELFCSTVSSNHR
jgi:hypothetical protein